MNVSGTSTLTGSYMYSSLMHDIPFVTWCHSCCKKGRWLLCTKVIGFMIICSFVLYILHSSRSIAQAGCGQRQFIHVL